MYMHIELYGLHGKIFANFCISYSSFVNELCGSGSLSFCLLYLIFLKLDKKY